MVSLATDPLFDYNKTEEYKLSIQISLDGFSFSVIQGNEPQLMACGFFPVTISSEKFLGRRFSEWIGSQEILHKKYAETNLCYFSQKFTLIPSEFYEYKKQTLAFNLNFGEQKENSVLDNYLPDAEGNLVFALPDSLIEAVTKIYPENSVTHSIALFHQKILEKYPKEKNKRVLALFFLKNTFGSLLYQDGRLLQINSFKFLHQNDVIYYTLSVLKALKLNSSKTQLLLAGNINENDAVHSSLAKHFEEIEFYVPPCHYNKEIFNEPLHLFTPLI